MEHLAAALGASHEVARITAESLAAFHRAEEALVCRDRARKAQGPAGARRLQRKKFKFEFEVLNFHSGTHASIVSCGATFKRRALTTEEFVASPAYSGSDVFFAHL